MSFPSLSIVIPSYNGRRHLERCLPTVRAHVPAGTQVIVVDDASQDGTVDWLRQTHPWVQTIALPVNQGFCGAVNAGLAAASGEIIELLNNDTTVTAGWADAALAHFADPAVGSVAPLVLNMDQPDVIDSAGIDYHVCGWAKSRGYGQTLGSAYQTPQEVFGPSGSSGFYRRSLLLQLGGLLPEYGAYFEDVDLAFRLRWLGYRCIYEPASRVYHQGSASYGRQLDRLVRLIARNEELVYWLNLPGWDLFKSLLPHLGFLAIRAIRKAVGGQLRAFLEGKREAFALRSWVARRRMELARMARSSSNELAISDSLQVLRQGWTWLRERKIA